MITTAVFDTNPYDRDHLQPATADGSIAWPWWRKLSGQPQQLLGDE
jgi:hypothetical protein